MASQRSIQINATCLGLQSALLFGMSVTGLVNPDLFGRDPPPTRGMPPLKKALSMTSIALASVYAVAATEPRIFKRVFLASIITRGMAVVLFWPHARNVALWEGFWAVLNGICLSTVW